jgi:hypothetical protein
MLLAISVESQKNHNQKNQLGETHKTTVGPVSRGRDKGVLHIDGLATRLPCLVPRRPRRGIESFVLAGSRIEQMSSIWLVDTCCTQLHPRVLVQLPAYSRPQGRSRSCKEGRAGLRKGPMPAMPRGTKWTADESVGNRSRRTGKLADWQIGRLAGLPAAQHLIRM